jgi:1-deoxy-D-xylulose-5-phosphate reductoisomerase
MYLPVQHALFYPARMPTPARRLDVARLQRLTFCEPDYKKFPCLALAYKVARMQPSASVALNAADEICVEQFLARKLRFDRIPAVIQKTVSHVEEGAVTDSIERIQAVDAWARDYTRASIARMRG